MAASDARPFPLKGQAYRVTFPLFNATGDLVSGAAGLDSEVSKDGGTFADCTNEATEIATSSGMYYLDLSSTEMNADTVAIIVKTSTSGAKTTPIVLYPVETGDIPVNVEQISGDSAAADNLEAACDGTGYNVGGGSVVAASVTGAVESVTGNVGGNVTGSVGSVTGNVGGNVTGSVGSVASGGITAASIATNAIDADALAADAVTEIQSSLATAAALATVDSNVDAILADTGTDGVAVADKTGYKLAADGLDSISTTGASGVASNFREMLVAVWRWMFKKSTMTATEWKTYADDGATAVTTQTLSDDGTTQTRGAAS